MGDNEKNIRYSKDGDPITIPNFSIKLTFGKRLKRIREDKGTSQEELAYKTKVHRTTISDIERGIGNITLETIEKICRGLLIEPIELFKWNTHIFIYEEYKEE